MRMKLLFCTIVLVGMGLEIMAMPHAMAKEKSVNHAYNGPYSNEYLNRVAFPLGGMGAGMICLEGTGAFSQVSVRNKMEFFNAPCLFSAICVKGDKGNVARILEGPIPDWKYFGAPGTGNGATGTSYGLPRFHEAQFQARFPFATIQLKDEAIVLETTVTGWSPFIPGSSDDSSLPVAGVEYQFHNPTKHSVEAVFSFNTKQFMQIGNNKSDTILPIKNGFVLYQAGSEKAPQEEGAFAAFVLEDPAVVDHCWFKGGWWDGLTLAWRNIQEGVLRDNPPVKGQCPGASLFVPLTVAPNTTQTVHLLFAWYVPHSDMRIGKDPEAPKAPEAAADSTPAPTSPPQASKHTIKRRGRFAEVASKKTKENQASCESCEGCCPAAPATPDAKCETPKTYQPWYAGKFENIEVLAEFWRAQYASLREQSALFRDTFYDTTFPPEVVEAVAANLTILKSPTVLRQADGRMWNFEGCGDNAGCCHGSCTHVWNYAQAVAHLFPDMERSLRETEFTVSQNADGHQQFRSNLPIRPSVHDFHAAADGQLGGIMKVYREWRIGGDTDWMKSLWPRVRQSLDYCIATWDPQEKGILAEPHHNTYDIEYWGPDGHCTSFYLGALAAAVKMGTEMGEDMSRYTQLLEKGRSFLETDLYNGEYFFQKIQTEGLKATFKPIDVSSNGKGYDDLVKLLNEQGPKYQYGTGCLSDGVLGFWIARACGLDEPLADEVKVRSHLKSVHAYNLCRDLSDHANPQRPSYAMGDEGGLLLCTWPRGGALAIPFVYSDEVWTGIEYQAAAHLILEGMVDEGLEIVRVCRDRYDGVRRNPFNEYECGHWYARALSSYGLLQALSGARYDAVDKTLYLNSRIGKNFRSFLSTATGFGTVGLKKGKPFLEVKHGAIDVQRVLVSGQAAELLAH